jgi:hypothetical protein
LCLLLLLLLELCTAAVSGPGADLSVALGQTSAPNSIAAYLGNSPNTPKNAFEQLRAVKGAGSYGFFLGGVGSQHFITPTAGAAVPASGEVEVAMVYQRPDQAQAQLQKAPVGTGPPAAGPAKAAASLGRQAPDCSLL